MADQNLPERMSHRTLELPVAEFEGEVVRVMLGKIPALNLEMEFGYPRGTHLKLELEVRCRAVHVDEFTAGPNRGELYREHIFALEEAKIIGVYTADELDPGVGGGLAAGAPETNGHPEPRSDGFPDF